MKRGRGVGGRPEVPACQAAIIQAMRFHFEYPVWMIAQKMECPSQTVSYLTMGDSTNVLPWWKRKYKTEAIDAARRILWAAASIQIMN